MRGAPLEAVDDSSYGSQTLWKCGKSKPVTARVQSNFAQGYKQSPFQTWCELVAAEASNHAVQVANFCIICVPKRHMIGCKPQL